MHHRNRRALFIGAAVATLVLGAGCGSAATNQPSTAAAATKDPVAWMDGVCGAILPIGDTAGRPSGTTTDPAAKVRELSAFLGTMTTRFDTAIAGVKAQGPSPLKGGDAAIAKVTDGLGSFRTTLQGAKAKMDAAPTNDPKALATVLIEVQTTLGDVENPLEGVDSDPEVEAAAKKAPNCVKISG